MMKKFLTSILILTFVLVSQTYAQDSSSRPPRANQNKTVTVDEEFLKELQLALAERDKLRVEVSAKNEIITAKDSQLAALRGLLQVQTQISEDWKVAATARKDAITIDDKMISNFEKELERVRLERDAARRNNKVWGAVGLIFGTALGWAAKK